MLFLVLITFNVVRLAPPWNIFEHSVGVPQHLGSGPLSIWIQDSQVPRLNHTTLKMYPGLRRFRVQRSNLEYIDEGAFDNNPLLEYLALVELPLKHLPATLGPAQISLDWVALDKVTTSFLNLTGGNYFREFPKLTYLGIGNNNDIGPQLNTDILPQQLSYLHMPRGRLEIFPNLSAVVPHLKHLRFFDNYIKVVPEECIAALKLMETLYASQNSIDTLPDLGFMTKLRILDISNNRLAALPDMYHLPLKKLMIARNPLMCYQTLCWLLMWPWQKASMLQDQPTCAGPGMLSGRKLMDVHPVDMECYQGKYCKCDGQQLQCGNDVVEIKHAFIRKWVLCWFNYE